MKVLIDSDALVKVTKAGLKPTFSAHFALHVCPEVEREVLTHAQERAYPETPEIQRNLARGRLRRAPGLPARPPWAAIFPGAEGQIATLHETGAYDAVLSDDQAFIRRMFQRGATVFTPAVALAELARLGRISRTVAREHLDSLRPLVSDRSYRLAVQQLKVSEGQR